MFNKLKIPIVIVLAVSAYLIHSVWLFNCAKVIGDIFINLLKLVSLPVVFLSIITAISSLKNIVQIKILLKKIIFYTLLTTICAAVVALMIYLIVNPSEQNKALNSLKNVDVSSDSYLSYLISIVPYNFVKIFLDNNIVGCIIFAFLIGGGVITISSEKHEFLYKLFSSLFDTFLEIAKLILKFMPIAIWAFITTFLYSIKDGYDFSNIIKYIICIVLANFIQAFIVLPLLIRYKGISVHSVVRGVMPALIIAFFSKSSTVTLPTTIDCVSNNLKVSKKLTSFVLPICTTINMNACAAFILTTVLFVSEMNLHYFSIWEMFLWVFIATGAAISNAGIPMGCYFVSMSCLMSMKIPLNLMGVILPVYVIIDMFETALNVWSDICITKIVAKEYKDEL
ncbi:dicarboxylate/amino acid:cation symporter [Neoehrlichia mikurensis]|nr:dicarboxylate/amino acid:cation symporter [Neoehrlichia mikurensis]QXK93194.1 dicarboxylate/amino acid:cation symporter [Neoehrlichia mikurensis]QXK94043.1 dicarboxylate/amino acid:cation symporter [Neoehrlichia mikurensis]